MGKSKYSPINLENRFNNPKNINFSLTKFPFPRKLSFVPLYNIYKDQLEGKENANLNLQKEIVKNLEKIPALLQPIEDLSILEKNKTTVDLIMATISPVAEFDSAITSAGLPFSTKVIFTTPKFDKLIDFSQFDRSDLSAMLLHKTYNAYRSILQEFYGKKVSVDKPMIVTFLDEKTKLNKHLKISINEKYCSVVAKGPVTPLSEDELDDLINNFDDLEKWFEKIPPENFEFQGLAILDFTEVTDQEAISELRLQLLDKSSVLTADGFKGLQANLRDLFGLKNLKLGLMSFSNECLNDFEIGQKIWNSILSDLDKMQCRDYRDSPYEHIFLKQEPVVVNDTKFIEGSPRFKALISQQKIRSLIVAPLIYEDKFVGILELASDEANDLTAFSLMKVKPLVSLFSMAVQRSLEDLASRVETIIREEYTAIHPTVAWKFEESANAILESRLKGENVASKPIVFENVFPLYGLSDIRGSSIERNNAIKDDLVAHLILAKDVINRARKERPMPILDQIKYRIDKRIQKVKKGLNSGDEVSILEFIRHDVEPVFKYLMDSDIYLGNSLHQYNSALNNDYGTLYRSRKEFEESLTIINQTISNYLDVENEKAQQIYPHYFEKYKTDGVEYNIYIGESIVRNQKYSPILLSNIRLWQLKTTCEIVRLTDKLKSTLPMPLEITQLILVQSNPLSIRFREDEKKFDVDGAYNIRYEIVKKRIDKAFIKGTNERLTQPGTIAIVYAHSREAQDYLKYIEYLQSIGYLMNGIEYHELEELPGANGLKAIRVNVQLKEEKVKSKIDTKNLGFAVSKMVN